MCVGSNLALQGKFHLDFTRSLKLTPDHSSEIKLVVAAIYTNYKTSIVNDDNIEAIDAYTVKPRGEKLVLRFESAQ